jgi:hypothetical protein
VNALRQSFDAQAFDPDLGNEVYSGLISADREHLRFESGEAVIEIPLSRADVSVRDARVFFHDPARPGLRLFTSDESILVCRELQQCYRLRTQIRRILVKREMSHRWKLVCYGVLICVVVGWLGSILFGVAVSAAVSGIPADWESKVGESVMEEIQEEFVFSNDTTRVAELAALAEPLTRTIRGRTSKIQFYIVDHREPNAFALPGGHVLVTTGLMDSAGRPEELLGVIAHEVAHVTERHGFRQIIAGAGPMVLLQIIFGNRGSALGVLLESSGVLIYQTHSQQHEREADATGWDYLVAANIDPRGMIDMLRRLKEWEDSRPFQSEAGAFSSHPALDKRIAWLEARWEKLPRKTGFIDFTESRQATGR